MSSFFLCIKHTSSVSDTNSKNFFRDVLSCWYIREEWFHKKKLHFLGMVIFQSFAKTQSGWWSNLPDHIAESGFLLFSFFKKIQLNVFFNRGYGEKAIGVHLPYRSVQTIVNPLWQQGDAFISFHCWFSESFNILLGCKSQSEVVGVPHLF